MNPAPFEFHRAASVEDAIGLLQTYGDDAKLIAGGHSLLPVMKLRLAAPEHLIDISRIDTLRGVQDAGDHLAIGALTTHQAIAQNELIRAQVPVLAEAADMVGDRQVRNRGTIGGTLAHADAAADYPAAILALEAELVATGPNGTRTIPAGEFFLDLLTTALSPDELLTEIRIPKLAGRTGANYQKLANQASGYAVVGVAAVITLAADGTIGNARIGITGTGAAATRATAAEAALRGQAADDATIQAASALAADGIDPLSDLSASAEYRLSVTRGLARRAIKAAIERARSA
jgi:carbon-monoxide dehydrogenase medium subunit